MRKNYFLIGVFALATITFAACSSEDKLGEERSDDNGNTEVIEGEPTWAKFTFKLGKDGVVARATHMKVLLQKKTSKICGLISSMSPVALKQRRIMLL